MGHIQVVTLWAPFLSAGQAQRKHSPASFRLWIAGSLIPSVLTTFATGLVRSFRSVFRSCFLEMGVGLIKPVRSFPVALRAAISRNRRKSCRFSSPSLSILSWQSSFDSWISKPWISGVFSVTGLLTAFPFRSLPTTVHPCNLSMWITRLSSSPIIPASHYTHCATNSCWEFLPYDMTLSRAYTIASLSFSKVIVIRIVIDSKVRGCRYRKLIDSRYRYKRYRYHKNTIINKDISPLVGIVYSLAVRACHSHWRKNVVSL